MRLICPNCDAHYEVESRLIPENGRDVQCSSCGDTWFQAPPTEEDEASPDLDSDIFAASAGADNTLKGQEDDPEIVADLEGQSDAAESDANDETDDGDATEASQESLPERAGLDEAVLNVLRQEAERETNARIEEGSSALETQTDMGLETGASEKTEYADVPATEDVSTDPEMDEVVRERTARLRGIEPEDLSDGSPTARRDLLPDIEEINSTLRATSDRKTGEAAENSEETVETRRSGFRTGFSLIIFLIAVLLGVYSFAPQIGEKVPSIDPALKSFVHTTDQARIKLDTFMASVTEKMNASEDPAE